MTTTQYQLRYEFGLFKKEEAQPEQGLADAILVVSILRTQNGNSYCIASADGSTQKPLQPVERFKIFGVMAADLSKDTEVVDWQRQIATAAHSAIKTSIRREFP